MKTLFILITMLVPFFGFAGGGGSSSDYGGGGSSFSSGSDYSYSDRDGGGEFTWESFLMGLLMFAVIVPPVVLIDKLVSKKTTSKMREMYDKKIAKEKESDHNDTEQEKWVHEEAEHIFIRYQQDWSDYNLESIREYTTENYFQHASLMLEAIDKMGRRNVVSDLLVKKTYLLTPINNGWELPITIEVAFVFNGTDAIMSADTKRCIHSDRAFDVIEHWNFIYDGKALKLDGITQSTESTPHLVGSIADFANENKLFYSADWGRLALPTEGLIFNGWGLSSADVNNHVVGKWNDCLVQIYTYSATPNNPKSYFLVGQINVPKTYAGVIVEAKSAKLKIRKPKDYEQFEMEWGVFNKKYKIYASNQDALTAFELLNPKFIEHLYERNLPYNFEVKENTIYFFAKVNTGAKEENYAELLNILVEAFHELKM